MKLNTQSLTRTCAISFLLLLSVFLGCTNEYITNEYITVEYPDGHIPRVIWVPDEYEKIQDAIWASEDGDVIKVRAGEYHEQLQFFDKNVSLISEAGPEETIIDGTGFWTAIWITGGQDTNMVVRGFTFSNTSDFNCRGMVTSGGSSPKIVNNIFTTTLEEGSGFSMDQNASIIRNNLFLINRTGMAISHSWGDFSNNMILHSGNSAFYSKAIHGQPLEPDYNLFWDYPTLYRVGGEQPLHWGENNITELEPIFEEGNFRLKGNSPGKNQGRPDILDIDKTQSDIGVYGGPYAY